MPSGHQSYVLHLLLNGKTQANNQFFSSYIYLNYFGVSCSVFAAVKMPKI